MNDSNDISLADALSGCAYSVRKSDLEKAARLMAAAFHDDPSIRYLEINTRIYMHLGFETADVSAIPDTDIKQYAMPRRPRGMGA